MPHMENCNFESRHLGLVTAGEIIGLQEIINTLAAQSEKSIDFDRLLEIASAAPALTYTDLQQEKIAGVKIAVAYDKAFCFYYQDALELLESLGAELVYFSPLEDKQLPECDGLYLGGGYPELYAKVLQDNFSMRASIKNAVDSGLPCIAECGGFMYLMKAFRDKNGQVYDWTGVVDGETYMTQKLNRFGYVVLTAKRDNMLCKKAGRLTGTSSIIPTAPITATLLPLPKLPEQKHGKRFTQRRTFMQAIRIFICGAIQSLLQIL